MNADDVKVIQKETAFQGYFHLDRYIFQHKLFEGGWGGEISREVLERGHAACCLLYDPDLDELVLIEQFRPGAYAALQSRWFDETHDSPWQIEIVAGIIEEGESPESLIKRESLEESGCEILELELIDKYLVSSGCSSETQFLFCGKIDASRALGIHGLAEEGENIRVFRLSVEKAFTLLDSGSFNNATILVAMHWFRQNHLRLQTQWSSATK